MKLIDKILALRVGPSVMFFLLFMWSAILYKDFFIAAAVLLAFALGVAAVQPTVEEKIVYVEVPNTEPVVNNLGFDRSHPLHRTIQHCINDCQVLEIYVNIHSPETGSVSCKHLKTGAMLKLAWEVKGGIVFCNGQGFKIA